MNELKADTVVRARTQARQQERGFTMVQLVVTVAVVGIVSTMAVVGMNQARASKRLQDSAREFTSYLKRARTDATRRHATRAPGVVGADPEMPSIQILNPMTYRVRMDFNGTGVVTQRDITLETGVSFQYDAIPPAIVFNWRGRITGGDATFTIQNPRLEGNNRQVAISVARAGDVTTNRLNNYMPQINATPNPTGSDVDSGEIPYSSSYSANR